MDYETYFFEILSQYENHRGVIEHLKIGGHKNIKHENRVAVKIKPSLSICNNI